MTFLSRLRRRASDDGLTLVELMVASMFLGIIGAVMINWLITVSATDDFEQESAVALEAMRGAKASLTKELRFAESIDTGASNAHAVVVWIDIDEDDAVGLGEIVTWTFQPGGTLTRGTDDPADPVALRASNLVYDAAAGPGSSRFSYDAAYEVVTIELRADVDQLDGREAKSIRTEVHLRS